MTGFSVAAIWRAADKVVYSRTRTAASTARTRLERDFDPGAVARLKAEEERDITVGGATLAGRAIAEGLVDEYQLIAVPAIVGGGTRWLPDGVRLDLRLVEERAFAGGAVYLRYAARA